MCFKKCAWLKQPSRYEETCCSTALKQIPLIQVLPCSSTLQREPFSQSGIYYATICPAYLHTQPTCAQLIRKGAFLCSCTMTGWLGSATSGGSWVLQTKRNTQRCLLGLGQCCPVHYANGMKFKPSAMPPLSKSKCREIISFVSVYTPFVSQVSTVAEQHRKICTSTRRNSVGARK